MKKEVTIVHPFNFTEDDDLLNATSHVWDVDTLSWVKATQVEAGVGGGGGGDASAANQVTGNASLSSIDTKLSSQATAAKQDTANASLATIATEVATLNMMDYASEETLGNIYAELQNKANLSDTQPVSGSVSVSNFPASQAITAASLPLPTGAATESTLSTLNGKVTAVNTGAVVISSSALPTGAASESTLSALNTKVTACNTGAVVVSSSALPTGAATEATLSSLSAKVAAPYVEYSQQFLATGSGTVWQNDGGYSSFVIQATSVFSGLVGFYGSNDNVTYRLMPFYETGTTTTQSLIGSVDPVAGSLYAYKYVKLFCITLTSGTPTFIVRFSTGEGPVQVMSPQAAAFFTTANLRDGAGSAVNKGQTTKSGSLPVTLASDQAVPASSPSELGTAINDYSTGSSIAADATSNHDYTVTALKTLRLNRIEASASGKMKIEVQVESAAGSGSFASKFVQFNSVSAPNMSVELKNPILVTAGVKVRVIRTNKDESAQDVYTTICGYEL
jgi:hypothetical protein